MIVPSRPVDSSDRHGTQLMHIFESRTLPGHRIVSSHTALAVLVDVWQEAATYVVWAIARAAWRVSRPRQVVHIDDGRDSWAEHGSSEDLAHFTVKDLIGSKLDCLNRSAPGFSNLRFYQVWILELAI